MAAKGNWRPAMRWGWMKAVPPGWFCCPGFCLCCLSDLYVCVHSCVCVLSVGAQLPSWIPFKVFSMLILSVVDSPSFKMHSATSQNLKTSFFFFFCRLCTSTAFSPCLPLNLSGTTFTVTPVRVVTATTLRIILSPCVGVYLSVANHGFSYAAFNPWCVGQAQQEGDAFVAFEKCCFFVFLIDHIER